MSESIYQDNVGTHLAQTHPGNWRIFYVFSKMALQGFGGVMPFAYRAMVEQERWLSATEFAELLGICQIFPGPTICNIAVFVGRRLGGGTGVASAVSGLLVLPFLIAIALGAAYQRFGDFPIFRSALNGMAAVAAGLILATALKMARGLLKKQVGLPGILFKTIMLACAFACLGLLKWRLLTVFMLFAPVAVIAAYLLDRR
ncbi:MAG: chromate transporter [Burkholderiales bacterium]|nr:chromate transporter [Burkholderiales bacterium]